MRRTNNMMTLIALLILVVIIGVGSRIFKAMVESSVPDGQTEKLELSVNTESVDSASGGNVEAKEAETAEAQEEISLEDALFIGDSRTVGLCEYGGLEEADFYADVGMSVYNIGKSVIEIPSVGKVTLKELLAEKKYGKIYLMLGVNELGYDLRKTMEKYQSLVDMIVEAQPDALLFLQANLHVTKRRSQSDDNVNNTAINMFNKKVSEMADGKKIIYLNANPVFDDSEGNLCADKTGDDTHLFAKYYEVWGDWIRSQSTVLMKEGQQ